LTYVRDPSCETADTAARKWHLTRNAPACVALRPSSRRTRAGAPGSECDAVAELGNVGFPAQTVAQRLLQGLHVLQLAVHQMQLGAWLEMADPVDQLGLAGVGRETAQRVHLRVHRDARVHQLDGSGAIDDRPPQRAAGLEAGYHQVTF